MNVDRLLIGLDGSGVPTVARLLRWIWIGRALAHLGAARGAVVTHEELTRALRGRDVETGERQARQAGKGSLVSLDLAFDVPPALDQLHQRADDAVRGAVELALIDAVETALEQGDARRVAAAAIVARDDRDALTVRAIVTGLELNEKLASPERAGLGKADAVRAVEGAFDAALPDTLRAHGLVVSERAGEPLGVEAPAAAPPPARAPEPRMGIDVPDPLDRLRPVLGDARAAALATEADGHRERVSALDDGELASARADLADAWRHYDRNGARMALTHERDAALADGQGDVGRAEKERRRLNDLRRHGRHPDRFFDRHGREAGEWLAVERAAALRAESAVREVVGRELTAPSPGTVERFGPAPAAGAPHRAEWETTVGAAVRDRLVARAAAQDQPVVLHGGLDDLQRWDVRVSAARLTGRAPEEIPALVPEHGPAPGRHEAAVGIG